MRARRVGKPPRFVADPKICHGQPTFRGTRIMVWQVLEMLADGMAWETIIEECHNSITKDAIAEAVKLSGEAFIKHASEGEANMLISVSGVYRNGKIELIEHPSNIRDETHVIVTFLEPGFIDLRTRGIDEVQAAELRARLATFAADWDSPEMSIYDNYDAVKANL